MKIGRWLWGPATGMVLILALTSPARAEGTHKFVGAEKCKMCHNAPAKGEQFKKWSESKHAQAYATLGTDAAKKLAEAKGIADPQKAEQCLKCHVTGHGAPAEMLTEKYKKEDGVSCESCHGPGGDYWSMAVMKDMPKATAAGLVMPDEAVCKKCHNPESPSFKDFNFAEAKAKIAHPNPQKGATK